MEILKGIYIVGLGLFIEKFKCLVFGDLHLGMEASLGEKGYLLPKMNFSKLKKSLEGIKSKYDIEKVIFNGDIKHDFGTISHEEWDDCLGLIDFFKGKEVILIKGNHDKTTQIIAKKRNLKVLDYYKLDDILICHGDIVLDQECDIIIIGHEHPAISLKEGPKVELYKCFLKGKFKGKDLIVMPSFSFVNIGSDVLKYETLSPYLDQNINNFQVFIVSDNEEVYSFGKIKDIE